MSVDLPAGWAEATLGAVVSRPRAKVAPGDHADLPFVGMDQIAPHSMALLGTTRFGDMKSNGALFYEGDVLYGRMRPYLNKVHRAKFSGASSAEFIVFPRSEGIDSDLLAYLLHHKRFVNFASAQSAGDRPRVDFDSLSSYAFALPPQTEQRRIVSKIDEFFSRIEEGERALERVQTLVDRYRQSVLKSAVTGELTREWREQRRGQLESGEVLLQRILMARQDASERSGGKRTYREPKAVDPSGLLKLPVGWVAATVDQLCFVETGATPNRANEAYFKDGTFDWVTSTAVNESIIRSAHERITELALRETNAKVFPVGTLIVAMYGEGKTRGKVAELGISAATNQACAALVSGHLPPAVKLYLRIFLEKSYETLRGQAAGGVQPNLNLTIIKTTMLPLPSLEELTLIGDLVQSKLSQIAAIEAESSSWATQWSALKQKILSEAFCGRL